MWPFKSNKSKGENKEKQEKPKKDKGDTAKKQKEDKPEIDVFQISDYLRAKLKEVKGDIEPNSMLPKLSEKKETLEKYIHQNQQEIEEIENLIPELEEKKKDLEEAMKQKREEISRIDEIEQILHL